MGSTRTHRRRRGVRAGSPGERGAEPSVRCSPPRGCTACMTGWRGRGFVGVFSPRMPACGQEEEEEEEKEEEEKEEDARRGHGQPSPGRELDVPTGQRAAARGILQGCSGQ
ncbi:unnamed protein product [Prorocentrum cordatum]|uniref:Uncharacterized protein n=1 Tax=Prorocentrum cordatum TaxID=2364126 RepID=A0ABN9V912_9DINO|nr:unnamed protein product [Polarella glacialis]